MDVGINESKDDERIQEYSTLTVTPLKIFHKNGKLRNIKSAVKTQLLTFYLRIINYQQGAIRIIICVN